jgi:hypothetical protein
MLKNIFIGIAVIILLVVISYDYAPRGHVYDCTLAEINPDYPIEVKEECRRLRREIQKEYLLQT